MELASSSCRSLVWAQDSSEIQSHAMDGIHEAMHVEDDYCTKEKAKRKLKTSAQVEALEEFFNEHNYPTEVMKSEFAKKIGLSEKQVSGWFCHRRLKEKKILHDALYTNGKRNVSSSAIHDCTSGVRQESCSSTKQVDKNIDSKEVESKMLYSYNSSAVVFASEASNKDVHAIHYDVSEDRSSCSSSAYQGRLQQNENLGFAQPFMYNISYGSCTLMSNRSTVLKRKGPKVNPRFSFLLDENEISVISIVKRKLGGLYREDGPPLGFKFDPIPPGAFESPVRDLHCEPCYVGDSMHCESLSICRSIKEHKVNNEYRLEALVTKSYPEQMAFNRAKRSYNGCSEITKLQTRKASISNLSKHAQCRNFAANNVENSMNQTSYLGGRNTLKQFNHTLEDTSDHKTSSNLLQTFPGSIKGSFPYCTWDAEVFQREHFNVRSSMEKHKKHDYFGSGCRLWPRKPSKDWVRRERAQENHAFEPGMTIEGRTKDASKINGAKFHQQCARKILGNPSVKYNQ